MYSLFEEQITHESKALDHFLNRGTNPLPRPPPTSRTWSITMWVRMNTSNLIRRHKEAVQIPIIGSLNGIYHRRLGGICQED